jgi:hypothetical protein
VICHFGLSVRAQFLRYAHALSLFESDQFQRRIGGCGDLPKVLGIAVSSLLRARLRVSMIFASARSNSPLGFPASLCPLGAEVPSFRFADEGANRAGAASAFRRTAQRSIDVADAPGAIRRRYGRPNINLSQYVTRTNDHPLLPGAGGPHRGFLHTPSLNKRSRYKGSGGYLVERDPLRQWGQAHFGMNLRNRWPRSAPTSPQSPKPSQLPDRPPFAHPAAATGVAAIRLKKA